MVVLRQLQTVNRSTLRLAAPILHQYRHRHVDYVELCPALARSQADLAEAPPAPEATSYPCCPRHGPYLGLLLRLLHGPSLRGGADGICHGASNECSRHGVANAAPTLAVVSGTLQDLSH